MPGVSEPCVEISGCYAPQCIIEGNGFQFHFDADRLELTVVRIDDGEVSPYLSTVLDVGDQFELRGPIGGYFVWDADDLRPVLLVAGGSGVVPLMAMLRHHAALDHRAAMHLVYSARARDDARENRRAHGRRG